MSTIDHIVNAVEKLSEVELAEFRAWFAEYDHVRRVAGVEAWRPPGTSHLELINADSFRGFAEAHPRPPVRVSIFSLPLEDSKDKLKA